MKSTSYSILDAIQLLDPYRKPTLFSSLALRLSNCETLFVKNITVDGQLIYAWGGDQTTQHMIPIDTVVGYEVGLKDPKAAWFKDAATLPAILAKRTAEERREQEQAA